MPRPLIMALGAAGALTAAATGVILSRDKTIPAEQARSPETVCIESNVRLVESMTKDCYSPAQYQALRDRPVIDGEGESVDLTLSGEEAGGSAVASTCAEYDAMIADGKYALSSAAMRREEYFKRACGALAMLAGASPAQSTHFAGGKANKSDVRSMANGASFGIGEAVAVPSEISNIEEGVWKLSSSAGETTIFEIAHADFTGDGLGEILAYVSTSAEAGTARAGSIGLIEKPSAKGPCSFRAG